MSGLEALGSAAAIAQFIQYATGLTRKVVEIYKSVDGTSKRSTELETFSNELHAFADSLTVANAKSLKVDEVEGGLHRIAEACQAEAAYLSDLLNRLKVQGPVSVLKSVKAAWRNDRQKSEIRHHEGRLNELRSQLNAQLLKAIYAESSSLAIAIEAIHRQNTDLEARMTRKFTDCTNDLLDALSRPQSKDEVVIKLLLDLRNEGQETTKRQAFLQSLRFPTMNSRYEGIRDPSATTFDWMLRDDASAKQGVDFVPWLRRDHGLYWVTGRAGSGKSTLMKLVSKAAVTMRHLKSWAGRRELFTASYFFWSSGDEMQKSQRGLLQTILFDVLRQSPGLIDRMSPLESDEIWTPSKLKKCIEIATEGTSSHAPDEPGTCYCFFVDGLDEYDGDCEELARLVLQMSRSANVKICASSRPWEVFRDLFKTSITTNRWLQLHLHTRDDIEAVAHQELDELVSDRQDDQVEVELLVEELVAKAEGIFLWVALVIKELIKGFRHADNLKSLRRRLESIPPGLDEYFNHILSKIDPSYRQESSRLFLCSLLVRLDWLPAQAFDYLARQDIEDMPPSDREITYAEMNNDRVLEKLRKRLNGRCLDLLQIMPNTSGYQRPFPVVQFLHRTVQEFLETGDVLKDLQQKAGSDYNAREVLCTTHLLLLRTSMCSKVTDQRWKVHWAEHVIRRAQRLELVRGRTMMGALTDMYESLDRSMPTAQWHSLIGNAFHGHTGNSFYEHPENLSPNMLALALRLGLFRTAAELLGSGIDLHTCDLVGHVKLTFSIIERLLHLSSQTSSELWKDAWPFEYTEQCRCRGLHQRATSAFVLTALRDSGLLRVLFSEHERERIRSAVGTHWASFKPIWVSYEERVLRDLTREFDDETDGFFRDLTWSLLRLYRLHLRQIGDRLEGVLVPAFGAAEAGRMVAFVVASDSNDGPDRGRVRSWFKLW